MKKILILTVLLSMISIPSFAEEVPVDQSAWDTESGWAVVDDSGVVQNIIVCTNSVCGNNEFLNTAIQNGAIAPGSKIVRQLPINGGAWGTYDSNTKTFTIDRNCVSCKINEDNYSHGTIKDGVVTPPITFSQINYVLLEKPGLTINEAVQLVKELLKFYGGSAPSIEAGTMNSTVIKNTGILVKKKSKYKTIKLTDNLKKFKKVSKSKNICKIEKNSVLILKSGTCKIDVYKGTNKKRVEVKVFK